ncbi:Uncharacterized protein Fot_07275 [Forsythia ovata]|uniref:Uncharacterized protein n=1 Tax=Forsythia ovata TaxID=205694 RepID=A0ABD1WVP1_9LAMI
MSSSLIRHVRSSVEIDCPGDYGLIGVGRRWEDLVKREIELGLFASSACWHKVAPRAYLPVAKGRADRAQRGKVQGSNPEILDLCHVASGSYHMVNSLGLSISSPPWLLEGTSCDLPPPPKV